MSIELKRAGCARIFSETASGGRWDRPELHRMLDQLRPGDVVVVWKLDRLTRSLKDLLLIMEKIDAAGAGFRSLTESIDTTTPAGRMMMQMVGTFAEFERAVIRERTTAGQQLHGPRGEEVAESLHWTRIRKPISLIMSCPDGKPAPTWPVSTKSVKPPSHAQLRKRG